MLYSATVIALSLAIPFLCLFSFKQGFRYGCDAKTASEEKILPEIQSKPRKDSKELEKQRKILQNIESYSGDGSNQVDI